MKLTISGEESLYKKFTSLTKVMKTTFWGYVRTDLEENLIKNVKPHVNHSTSKLEQNTYAKITDDGVEGGIRNEGMEVSWNGIRINYAVFVNGGTSGPYPIRPKNKKILRWQGSSGRNFFSKEVMHPGIKASHFIENSAQATFKNLDKMFNKALKAEGL